jgi:hypothetical protein
MNETPDVEIVVPIEPALYLGTRERLVTVTYNVVVKSFRFHAILTDQRILLIDHDEQKPGVFARELLRPLLKNCFFEENERGEPVLVLSVQTLPDEQKTMKLTFSGRAGIEAPDMAEWLSLAGSAAGAPSNRSAAMPGNTAVSPESAQIMNHSLAFAANHRTVPRDQPRSVQIRKPSFRRGGSFRPDVPVLLPDIRTAPDVRFCHQCGEKIIQNARFCPFCGASVKHLK